MKLDAIPLIVIILLLNVDGCKEDPKPKSELEKLPPATEEGRHTFGCLVNRTAWVTETSTRAAGYYQEGYLFIGADVGTQSMGLNVHDEQIVDGNKYILSGSLGSDASAEFTSWGNSFLCDYPANSTIIGSITITKIDTNKLIISGLFEFSSVTSECDTLRVTDGRFDLTYAN